jgi:hypothetical protein
MGRLRPGKAFEQIFLGLLLEPADAKAYLREISVTKDFWLDFLSGSVTICNRSEGQ